jgi:hypothetical protein
MQEKTTTHGRWRDFHTALNNGYIYVYPSKRQPNAITYTYNIQHTTHISNPTFSNPLTSIPLHKKTIHLPPSLNGCLHPWNRLILLDRRPAALSRQCVSPRVGLHVCSFVRSFVRSSCHRLIRHRRREWFGGRTGPDSGLLRGSVVVGGECGAGVCRRRGVLLLFGGRGRGGCFCAVGDVVWVCGWEGLGRACDGFRGGGSCACDGFLGSAYRLVGGRGELFRDLFPTGVLVCADWGS